MKNLEHYTHCYGRSINLAVNDVIKLTKPIGKALETTHEITKLIKHSQTLFRELKRAHDQVSGIQSPGIRDCFAQQGGLYGQIRQL